MDSTSKIFSVAALLVGIFVANYLEGLIAARYLSRPYSVFAITAIFVFLGLAAVKLWERLEEWWERFRFVIQVGGKTLTLHNNPTKLEDREEKHAEDLRDSGENLEFDTQTEDRKYMQKPPLSPTKIKT